MAKRKKNKSGNLSHEEIWDDSALLQSWDDAVEEYNLYHSINARGEDVEAILDSAERYGVDAAAETVMDHESMDVEDDTGGAATGAQEQITVPSDGNPSAESGPSNAANTVPPPTMAQGPSVPDALAMQVQDPALKNLMMAWYYAGYYTGLYEGQRQNAPNDNPAN